MPKIEIFNWKRSIFYHASSVEKVASVEDIQRIIKDRERYPAPVRVRGSHHSTTRCVVADGGTVIDMKGMNRILSIDKAAKTITMEAGVLHIDAAKALEKEELQLYVNCEIGNLTVGSGACGGTKDASYFADGAWEFGQVASYCVGMKAVQADGSILEVTDDDEPELMAAMRSSYGMLGVIYEVTFKVKTISAMSVEHVAFHVDDFADRLDALIAQNRSMMLYLFPFLDRVVIEYRGDVPGVPVKPGSWQWRVRNYTWKTLWPLIAKTLGYGIPVRALRFALIKGINRLTSLILVRLIRDRNSSPADQVIRYADTAPYASYTFSIWAFSRETYPQAIKDYFAFCKNYNKRNHYRCDLMNVGYHIVQDRQSLFSYTRRGPALTLDPVATGLPGWEDFLIAYNQFCSDHDGTPLFNQTGSLAPYQAQKAFHGEINQFLTIRARMDPDDRFYTEYFKRLFEGA
jgi:hypothetical protein